ncbi:hypothetical protein ABZS66_35095 [Dactylosporangium sp. NPDC005572]|uniref:hypothetical protein n=1 Tax=Dactylosporangium sp. NPDC005572 TaxID=3156889 RepID=UPI0033AB78CE
MMLTRRTALIVIGAAVGVLLLWVATGELGLRPRWPWDTHVLGTVLAPSAVVLASSVLQLWLLLGWDRPSALETAGEGFVAPAAYVVGVAAVGLVTGVVLLGVPQWLAGGINPITLLYVPLYGAAVVGVAVWITAIVRGAGRIVLRPDGLFWVDALGDTFVPWDAIAAGPLPGASRLGEVDLGIARPDLVGRRGATLRDPARLRLPAHLALVHRRFLANAVNYYLWHPEERAAIGTPAGYERLLAAIGGPRS